MNKMLQEQLGEKFNINKNGNRIEFLSKKNGLVLLVTWMESFLKKEDKKDI